MVIVVVVVVVVSGGVCVCGWGSGGTTSMGEWWLQWVDGVDGFGGVSGWVDVWVGGWFIGLVA